MKVNDWVIGKDASCQLSHPAQIQREIEPGKYFYVRFVGNRDVRDLRLATFWEVFWFKLKAFLARPITLSHYRQKI